MMTKSLSTREKVLIVILAIILIAALYYLVIFKPSHDAISAANAKTDEIADLLIVEETRAAEIARMRAALEEVSGNAESGAITPIYDNFQNLLDELNYALVGATNFDWKFGDPVIENGVATRTFQLIFYADNYGLARSIVNEINGGPYRNDIKSIKINPTGTGETDISGAAVSVSLSIDYYEIYPQAAVSEG